MTAAHQLTAVLAVGVGCEVIRSEKVSATSTAGRAELRTILDFLRKGDVLTVTRIDRLARSSGVMDARVSPGITVREERKVQGGTSAFVNSGTA